MRHSLRRIAGATCVLAFLGVFGAAAQPSAYEGKTIVDVQFPNGQPLDPADLARVQPLKPGQPLHSEDVAHAIDGLFGTGLFSNIVVEGEPSGNGVIVRFVTTNAWFLSGVTVQGKVLESPNKAQVEGAGEFSLGTPFHDADVKTALASMRRLFDSNGLYEAQVAPSVERDSDSQQVFLTFHVKTGKRAKYEMPAITGAAKLPDATILRATGWRLPIIHWWRHVTSTRTRGGVQGVLNKYGKQDRLLASVELKKLDYDAPRRRVRPNLDIDAGPKVKVSSVETKVSHRVLKRYVPVFQEHTVDDDLLNTGRLNLREYFQGQGYYDATVDFRVQPVQNDVETIEYSISRGMRYKLVRLTITGNHYFDTQSIRQRMFMQPAGFLILRHGRYSEAFQRKDEENITNLYSANGFREAKVTSIVAPAAHDKPGSIAVTVHIDEGRQWLVDDFAIQGVTQFKLADLPAPASAAGQPFAEVNIANDRDSLLTYYYTHGFPKAEFKAAWQPIEPGHVRVVYNITEGEREFVRDVLINGLHTTRESLVEKKITLKPGDPLSPVAQTDIQKSLYDLGVFAAVETAIENPDGDTTRKNVIYHFEEANRYTFSLGFGLELAQFGTPNNTSLGSPGGTFGVSPLGSPLRQSPQLPRVGTYSNFSGRVFLHRKARLPRLLAAALGWCRESQSHLLASIRQYTQCPHLRVEARGSFNSTLAKIQEKSDRAVPVFLPERERQRRHYSRTPNPPVPGIRAHRNVVYESHARSARQPAEPAPWHVQYRECRGQHQILRIPTQLRSRIGAQCNLLFVRQELGARAPNSVWSHSAFLAAGRD